VVEWNSGPLILLQVLREGDDFVQRSGGLVVTKFQVSEERNQQVQGLEELILIIFVFLLIYVLPLRFRACNIDRTFFHSRLEVVRMGESRMGGWYGVELNNLKFRDKNSRLRIFSCVKER